MDCIQDIIKIFPYAKFNDSNFRYINHILKCILENAAKSKINFKIKIDDNEPYDFKFQEKDNENINVLLVLKLNDENILLISQDTEINNNKFQGNNYNEYQINNIYLIFLEKVYSSKTK